MTSPITVEITETVVSTKTFATEADLQHWLANNGYDTDSRREAVTQMAVDGESAAFLFTGADYNAAITQVHYRISQGGTGSVSAACDR